MKKMSVLLDRNERQLSVGDRVRMVGEVLMVNSHQAQVKWEHPDGRVIVGYVLNPGCLEVLE